ncbi:MAG TPA: hypothetical protein VJU86_19955 [Pyrinomonadaceae bacterium]|nr:hypothetical protein [Pyrinomonadaceae bacterium]
MVVFSLRATLPVILLVSSLPSDLNAQTAADKPSPKPQPASSPAKSAADTKASAAAAKAKIDQQRALALSLLVSLANDARSYTDQRLRARTLSRIADALWEPDPEQGRALFRRAWDAAVVADTESLRLMEEDRRRQEATSRAYSVVRPPDLRGEVLRLAARNDRALGEELLEKLTEARKQEAAEAAAPRRGDIFETPAAQRQRLQLARQLLESDVDRALQFGDPGLTTVTMEGLSFLSFLRDKNPAAADQRYARMLSIAEADIQADANTVSLLSSYLFTPHLFVTFGPEGGQSSSQMNRRVPPPEVAPALRNAFFRTAAQILLRPSPTKEQDRSTSGMQGRYMVIKRLLPLFEQYAAKGIADQLRNEVASLSQGTNRTESEDAQDAIGRGLGPERSDEDMEKSLLDRIERAKTADERDGLYLQLATMVANKGDMRARDFTDKIEEIEMRKQAKPFIDMTLALSAVEKKDHEKALLLAEKGDLSQIQRVWLLTQTVKMMPAAEKEKALDVADQAGIAARRIGGSEADRPRALVAVANAYLATDRARAWETMLEVVKASNSAEGFNGEDGRLMIRLQTKFQATMRTSSVEDFNLAGIFRALALDNASQSVEMARSFEGEAPRATALIAVARALLSEKPKTAN